MRKSKFTGEQIIGVLKEVEAGGKPKDAWGRLGVVNAGVGKNGSGPDITRLSRLA